MAVRHLLAAVHNLSHLTFMYIFRKNCRRLKAAWRRYDLFVDDKRYCRIADGELVNIDDGRHTIFVSTGRVHSKKIKVDGAADTVILCERVPAVNNGRPVIKLTVTNVDNVQDSLLRFDRPPYIGGRVSGLLQAIGSIGAVIGFFLWIAILGAEGIARNPIAAVIMVPIIVLVGLACFFLAATGLRVLYYYFRLPRDWRH